MFLCYHSLQQNWEVQKSQKTLPLALVREQVQRMSICMCANTYMLNITGQKQPSTAVYPKRNKTKEDGDAHEWGGGRCSEELPVLDLEVPEHRQHKHEQRHHEAPHVESHMHLVSSPCPGRHGPCGMLRDVAVQNTVVSQVERGHRLGIVLKELALINQTYLVLLSSKVSPENAIKQKFIYTQLQTRTHTGLLESVLTTMLLDLWILIITV